VLLAMGFLGPEKKVIEEMTLKMDPRGNIQTPENKYSTSVPHVYAAGGIIVLSCFFICF
jgi:glutamate synthase (NADPH/NADH)